MDNEAILGMNFEQFLRGKFNACSEKAPKSLNEAVQNPNLPHEIKMFHGGTLKHRIDTMEDFSVQKAIDGVADESFSIRPITEAQEDELGNYTKQFYESIGYKFDKKDSFGLSDTYFFRNNSGEVIVITYTLPLYNEKDSLLVSTAKVRVR